MATPSITAAASAPLCISEEPPLAAAQAPLRSRSEASGSPGPGGPKVAARAKAGFR